MAQIIDHQKKNLTDLQRPTSRSLAIDPTVDCTTVEERGALARRIQYVQISPPLRNNDIAKSHPGGRRC